MTHLTYAAATVLLLSSAGAAFAQAPARTPDTGNVCKVTDYGCTSQPKGLGTGNSATSDADDLNAARLRNELRTPAPMSSNEPEEPEQPIHSATEPEAPISNAK